MNLKYLAAALLLLLCAGGVSAWDLFPKESPVVKETPVIVALTAEDLNPVVYKPSVEKAPITVVGTKMMLALDEKAKPLEILQVDPSHPEKVLGDSTSAVSVLGGVDLTGKGAINLRFRVGELTIIIRRGVLS